MAGQSVTNCKLRLEHLLFIREMYTGWLRFDPLKWTYMDGMYRDFLDRDFFSIVIFSVVTFFDRDFLDRDFFRS